MNIPDDILKRLQALGENPAQFADIYKSRDADFSVSSLHHYVQRREQQISLFREWSPKLRGFAAGCRANDKCHTWDDLTESDRAKLQIYEGMITKAERIRPRDETGVIICCIPPIGIPVARRLWPGEDTLSVILTPDELARWRDIYKHPEDAIDWWVDYWWKIEDLPQEESLMYRREDLVVPEGELPWVVESGLAWGPLAGGINVDLWSWNGKEARFVRNLNVIQF